MPTIKYFSAERAKATTYRATRLIIRNRANLSAKVERQWVDSLGMEWEQVKAVYTSPMIRVEKLWFDDALGLLFFRTIEE